MSGFNTGLTPASHLQPWQRSVHIPGAQSFPPGITHEIAWSNYYQRRDPYGEDEEQEDDERYQIHRRHAAGIVLPREPFTLTTNIARPSAPPPDHLPSYANGDGEVPAGQHGPLAKLPGLGIGGWVGMGHVSPEAAPDSRGLGNDYKPGVTLPSVRRPQTGVKRCLAFHLNGQKQRPATVPLPSVADFHSHNTHRHSAQYTTHLPYMSGATGYQMTYTTTSPLNPGIPPQRCGLYAPTQLQQMVYPTPPASPYRQPDVERTADSVPIPPMMVDPSMTAYPSQTSTPLQQYRHTPPTPKLLIPRPAPSYVHERHYDRRLLRTCYQSDFGPRDYDGGGGSALEVRGQGVDGRYRKAKAVHVVPPWAAGPSKRMTMRTGADHLCTFATGIAPCSNFNNKLH
ncbi:hypothetical protein HDU87_002260 [Geranomyces variabilis]|uniref:Uncharacterized protein n=1 Tax=Geranomyces variabilis TaxID=109894 RepID=A0AAD5TN30_9FUNG|nr:hypothetical protein HDU87_002260 [Geranomyces variabilis]